MAARGNQEALRNLNAEAPSLRWFGGAYRAPSSFFFTCARIRLNKAIANKQALAAKHANINVKISECPDITTSFQGAHQHARSVPGSMPREREAECQICHGAARLRHAPARSE